MKLTLLQIVQDILTAIDSENVQSVDETPEAVMAVNIVNRAFESMLAKHRWRHLRTYTNLSTTANLNELVLPSNGIAIDPNNIWYAEQHVNYLIPEHFLALTITRDETQSDITVIDNIKVKNDANPRFFTSDNDINLIFDSMPSSIDGLEGSDSLAIVYTQPVDRMIEDDDYFNLPAQAFPALTDLAISLALDELKGDTQAAQRRANEHVKKMGVLARNARLIDIPSDRRKWIVPRRTRRMIETPRIL